jgi:hypothetical protein
MDFEIGCAGSLVRASRWLLVILGLKEAPLMKVGGMGS